MMQNKKELLVGFEVLTVVVMKSFAFCDITLCSPLKAELAICFTMVSYLAHSSTLKMEVTCSSETIG
jgi:hypothetical protein